jgi:hypothetical protein
MEWSRIHAIAEETELWLSLGVNLWIILTAIAFTTLKVMRRADPDGKLLAQAAYWSGFVLGAVAALATSAVGLTLLSLLLQTFFKYYIWH